jgi:hypothetical protein
VAVVSNIDSLQTLKFSNFFLHAWTGLNQPSFFFKFVYTLTLRNLFPPHDWYAVKKHISL